LSKTTQKRLVIDLDGTICSQEKTGKYHAALPKCEVIKKINELWTDGWEIVIFTARGMNTCDGDVDQIEKNYREMTQEWLKKNRVCYDKLVFGKLDADLFVDDKCIDPGKFVNLRL